MLDLQYGGMLPPDVILRLEENMRRRIKQPIAAKSVTIFSPAPPVVNHDIWHQDDSHLQKLCTIYDLISKVDSSSVSQTIDSIIGLGFTFPPYISGFLQILIIISSRNPQKRDVFKQILKEILSMSEYKEQHLKSFKDLMPFGFKSQADRIVYDFYNMGHATEQEVRIARVKAGLQDVELKEEVVGCASTDPLAVAIMNDDIETFKKLTSTSEFDFTQKVKLSKFDVYPIHIEGANILQYAVFSGAIKITREFIPQDIDWRFNLNDYTLTDLAACSGSTDIMLILKLKQLPITEKAAKLAILFHRVDMYLWIINQDPQMICEDYEFIISCHSIRCLEYVPTPLAKDIFETACKHNSVLLAQALVFFYPLETSVGCYIAVENKAKETAQYLLTSDNKVDFHYMKNGRSFYYVACHNKDRDIMNILLGISSIDVNDGCPLIQAIRDDDIEAFEILLETKEIDVNKICEGTFPLAQAVDKPEMLRKLLKSPKIDLNLCVGSQTALIQSVIKNCKQSFDILLSQPKINVHQENSRGETALYHAVKRGDVAMTKAIIEKDKQFNINHVFSTPDSSPVSLLILAIKRNHADVFEYLLSIPEVDVNMQTDNIGMFPLYAAIPYPKMLKVLVSKSRLIDYNQKVHTVSFLSYSGKLINALSIACLTGQAESVKILLDTEKCSRPQSIYIDSFAQMVPREFELFTRLCEIPLEHK